MYLGSRIIKKKTKNHGIIVEKKMYLQVKNCVGVSF